VPILVCKNNIILAINYVMHKKICHTYHEINLCKLWRKVFQTKSMKHNHHSRKSQYGAKTKSTKRVNDKEELFSNEGPTLTYRKWMIFNEGIGKWERRGRDADLGLNSTWNFLVILLTNIDFMLYIVLSPKIDLLDQNVRCTEMKYQ